MLAGYEKAVPGFGNLLTGITGGVQKEISQAGQLIEGIMPADIVARTYQTGALQNLMSGLQGAPAGVANLARNFGIASTDLIGQGAHRCESLLLLFSCRREGAKKSLDGLPRRERN